MRSLEMLEHFECTDAVEGRVVERQAVRGRGVERQGAAVALGPLPTHDLVPRVDANGRDPGETSDSFGDDTFPAADVENRVGPNRLDCFVDASEEPREQRTRDRIRIPVLVGGVPGRSDEVRSVGRP
jgi:hypothetical protein